jgi:Mg2+ and Co2+ transporter CorA
MDLIPRDWIIPDVLRSRLGDEGGRQRAMFADGHLLLVLHEVPKPNDPDRKTRLLWRAPNGTWDSSSQGGGVQSLLRHLAEFSKVIDALEERLLKAQLAHDYFSILQHVSPLWRSTRNMANTFQEARGLVENDRDLIIARDKAGNLERACELLHADAVHGLDYTVARQGEEMAKASQDMANAGHRLNLMAALFLPLTAVTSIFSMQLSSGLEHIASPWLFWGVLVVGITIGLIVKSGITQPPKSGKNTPR